MPGKPSKSGLLESCLAGLAGRFAAAFVLVVGSERLGHHSVAFTLDTYAHVLPGWQAEAAEKLADQLFADDIDNPEEENPR